VKEMLVGYNHNIGYKGEVFHVQTEDSGINTPHIITLLYRGGNILASKKTSYADIVKMGNLSQVVEELMKEQHKEMLRRLKNGEFDDRLGLEGVLRLRQCQTLSRRRFLPLQCHLHHLPRLKHRLSLLSLLLLKLTFQRRSRVWTTLFLIFSPWVMKGIKTMKGYYL